MSSINSNNKFDNNNNINQTEISDMNLQIKRHRNKCKRSLKGFLISIKIKNVYIIIIIILSVLLILIITNTENIKIFPSILFNKNESDNNQNNFNIQKDFNKTENKNGKFFFFEKNQNELNYCENYGIMIYDYYYDGKIMEGSNIGDYIQSLAALQFLPKNCKPYFVDRDIIQFYHGPDVKLIMNGWHRIHEGNKFTSQEITPIYVSYHIRNEEKLPLSFINNIKKYEPIGTRDLYTRDKLKNQGVKAYFSSCLTTTLDIDYLAKENERTNEIIFIDYKFGDFIPADKYLYSLKAYNFNNITYINHQFDIKLTHVERFQLAKKLLDKYARAKLIISTRLHGSLPCLALNTPVIYIDKEYNYRRYPGIYELLNTVGINSKRKFEIRVNIDKRGLVYNPKKYLEYSKILKKQLKNI